MAVPTVVTFSGSEILPTGSTRVYRRSLWADAWVLDTSLVPVEVAWSCFPTMPTATLILHYGLVRWFDSDDWVTQLKLRGVARSYVKISVDCERNAADDGWNTRDWYGVIEVTADEQAGAQFDQLALGVWKSTATGTQTVHAYGMEHLLSSSRIQSSAIEYDGTATNTEELIPFNRDGRGNRTPVNRYGSTYVFETDLDAAAKWTSANIAEYVLRRHGPRSGTFGRAVPFALAAGAWLPTWDSPQIDPTDNTTLAIMQRLCPRQRLISAWFEVAADVVELHTNTITPAAVLLSIPGAAGSGVPENSNPLHVISDEDQFTAVTVKDSDLPVYDVVVAKGANEISVGTFSYLDSTLENGWTAAQAATYGAGSTGAAGYGGWNVATRQKANAGKRGSPELDKVYSHFQIPRTWNQKCKDGTGGTGEWMMFPGPDGAANRVYYPTMFTQQSLPLKKGANYYADAIETGATGETKATKEWMTPLVLLKHPTDDRWIRAEDIGSAADGEIETAGKFQSFSLHVHVDAESHGFNVRVAGSPQHTLAYNIFARLPEDPAFGQWSYATKMLATLALHSGRRVQGQWPAVAPVVIDAVKTLVIDAGNGFAAVYVVPQTVVGILSDGTLMRSNGGWLYRPADAVEQLTAMAKMSAAWYGLSHLVLTIETRRITTEINLGDLITKVGDTRGSNQHQATTNAPVSELRLSWPLERGDHPGAPTLTISTFAGELDPLQVGPSRLADARPRTPTPLIPHVPGPPLP